MHDQVRAMAQQVLAAKPADLSSILRTHMVEGKNMPSHTHNKRRNVCLVEESIMGATGHKENEHTR